MKKYIVIVDGKIEVDSSALDRAKQYAVEALRGAPDGSQAHIYSHVTTAVHQDVLWRSTPNGEATRPAKSRRGIKCPRWTRDEDDRIRDFLPSALGDGALADATLSQFPRRTERALAYRIGQIRRGVK